MRARRAAVLAAPAVVPVSMDVTFRLLARRLPPRAAYNAGFAVYWLVWCLAFPAAVVGPRRALRLLTSGRRPGRVELAVAAVPVAGAVGTALLPHRRQMDPAVVGVMAGSAVLNAVGEELLWRALPMHEFPDDVLRGLLWPLAGFALWHVAPQRVLVAEIGRWRFVLGAAVVGGCSSVIAWRTRGVRAVLLPHVVTDACGVTAARFRLGR